MRVFRALRYLVTLLMCVSCVNLLLGGWPEPAWTGYVLLVNMLLLVVVVGSVARPGMAAEYEDSDGALCRG